MLWRQTPGWGSDQELAALAVEVGHSTMRVLVSAYSKKGATVPKPLRVPRPTDAAKPTRPRRRIRESEVAAYGGSIVRVPRKEAVPDAR
jgi:hypothetical protein